MADPRPARSHGKMRFSGSALWFLAFTARLGEDLALLKKHYLANNLINFIYIPGNEMLRAPPSRPTPRRYIIRVEQSPQEEIKFWKQRSNFMEIKRLT